MRLKKKIYIHYKMYKMKKKKTIDTRENITNLILVVSI